MPDMGYECMGYECMGYEAEHARAGVREDFLR